MRLGLITYLRTESVTVSPGARQQAAEFIRESFGPDYLGSPPVTSGPIAPGHEAIRPTRIDVTPADLWKVLEKRRSR